MKRTPHRQLPWGVSTKYYHSPIPGMEKEGGYFVKCRYSLRVRLPKYLRLFIQKGLLSQGDFLDLIAKHITDSSFKGQAVESYFFKPMADVAEVTFNTAQIGPYEQKMAHGFQVRCREGLRDCLDYIKAFIIQNPQHPKLKGWKITKTGSIYYPRH